MPNTTTSNSRSHRKPGVAGAINAENAKARTNGARAMQRSTRQSPYKVRLVVDQIRGKSVNEGPKLKRFTPAAMGRATPVQKRTSHVEIVVAEKEGR